MNSCHGQKIRAISRGPIYLVGNSESCAAQVRQPNENDSDPGSDTGSVWLVPSVEAQYAIDIKLYKCGKLAELTPSAFHVTMIVMLKVVKVLA